MKFYVLQTASLLLFPLVTLAAPVDVKVNLTGMGNFGDILPARPETVQFSFSEDASLYNFYNVPGDFPPEHSNSGTVSLHNIDLILEQLDDAILTINNCSVTQNAEASGDIFAPNLFPDYTDTMNISGIKCDVGFEKTGLSIRADVDLLLASGEIDAHIFYGGQLLTEGFTSLNRATVAEYELAELSAFQRIPCLGDVNGDGQINFADLLLTEQNYGKNSSVGDANGDGKVDIFDLAAVSNHYGTKCFSW